MARYTFTCLHSFCLPPVQVDKPHGCADPLATDSEESAGSFAQTPHTSQETHENRQQQERSDPEIQDTEKTSPVLCSSSYPLSLAAVNTEQQNQSTPSLKTEHVSTPEHSPPGPGQHNESPVLPSISAGSYHAFTPYEPVVFFHLMC